VIEKDPLLDSFKKLKLVSMQRDAQIHGSGLWEKWHKFADANYEPARKFFIELLRDPRPHWRAESISFLGFHYDLDEEILNKIRSLLISDTDTAVRIAAASVLGEKSIFPDKALLYALSHDANLLVRETAFSSILDLAGIPYKIRVQKMEQVEAGDLNPDIENIKHILTENKISFTELD
jgi:hypothetical protein